MIRVVQQHLGVAQLPLLLLQAGLQLHGGRERHRHLLEPAVELIPGPQVLAPVQPHPLDPAAGGSGSHGRGEHPPPGSGWGVLPLPPPRYKGRVGGGHKDTLSGLTPVLRDKTLLSGKQAPWG